MPRYSDTKDGQRLLEYLATNGTRNPRGKWPFQHEQNVVYGPLCRVTQVLFCVWEPGWNEWNVCLRNRERGEGCFYLPAKHLLSYADYLRSRILTTRH